MPKDFARRAGSSTGRGSRNTKKRQPAKRVSPKARVLFHGPSFATGALVGAAIVILTAYGPELLQMSDTAPAAAEADTTHPQPLEFTFPDALKHSEVAADPEPYAVPEEQKQSLHSIYSIQAASFRNKEDADQLRARLLLQNMQARTAASRVNGQTWYRVVVGPFQGRLEADRAMTRLREQGLSAIRLRED